MLTHVLFGGGLAFAAAVQPGPFQAFLLARVAATGWRRTLPACVAPLLSDGPIAILALALLGCLPAGWQQALRGAGGILLLYLAWTTYREWRGPATTAAGGSAPRTLLQAALVNLLNPNPYLGWALVLGPSLMAAWNERPAHTAALLGAFYGTIVAVNAAFVVLVGATRFLGPRARRVLVAVSVALLAGLGAYLLPGAIAG